jgi:hypothetical protein
VLSGEIFLLLSVGHVRKVLWAFDYLTLLMYNTSQKFSNSSICRIFTMFSKAQIIKYVILRSIPTLHIHMVQCLCTSEILYSPLTGNLYCHAKVQKWILLKFLKLKKEDKSFNSFHITWPNCFTLHTDKQLLLQGEIKLNKYFIFQHPVALMHLP